MSPTKQIILAILFLVGLKLILSNREYLLYFQDTYQNRIILLFILNIMVYRYLLKALLLRSLYYKTIADVEAYIASLYYILLVGAIGSRKSANLTAFAQMCEMSKIKRMHDNQHKTQTLLSHIVDFKHLDHYIVKNLNPKQVYNDLSYKQFVYTYFKSYSAISILAQKIAFESFRTPSILNIMAEYVEVFYYINFRKANILSNTTIESINTNLKSFPVKESFFQLYRQNTLAHEKYLVIVEDEKGVVDNARVYARMDKDSVKDNDDGKDIHAMLQRHGSKGTNTTLVVSQSEKDVTANRRRLPNRFVEFLKPSDAFIFDLELKILKSIKNRIKIKEEKFYKRKMRKVRRYQRLYHLRKKAKYLDKALLLEALYADYLNQANKYKKRLKKYERLSVFLGKFLYIIQPSFLHENDDHIGHHEYEPSKVINSFPLLLVYPANITYDRYDQYAYYDVYNERNKHSITPLSNHTKFKSKIMSRQEHELMNYRAINKIYEEIDQHKNPTSKISKSSKPKSEIHYDSF